MAKGKSTAGGSGAAKTGEFLVADNKKARHLYEILDTFEAGLVLRGTEVKVLRQGKVHLEEAYCRFLGDELWLVGANIPEYSHGNLQNHEPKRRRKCLLKRQELQKLADQTKIKGLTLVPLRVYFGQKGYAKLTVGVGRGRKLHDKRQHLKEKEAKKEMRGA